MDDPVTTLSDELDRLRGRITLVDQAREECYGLQREVTRSAATAIRLVHRGELADAAAQLGETRRLLDTMNGHARSSPQVYFAGFVQDAQKEYAEAAAVLAMIEDRAIPLAADLDIEPAPYLNGLVEAATELRRLTLDALQQEQYPEARRRLDWMEAIYDLLVTFDYPDQVVMGLKRRLDPLRASLERTNSDVLTTFREAELQHALERVEKRLSEES